MIDERRLIEKFLAWRKDYAHSCMSARPAPNDYGVGAAFERGQYNGMLIAEKFLAEVLKEGEKDDE